MLIRVTYPRDVGEVLQAPSFRQNRCMYSWAAMTCNHPCCIVTKCRPNLDAPAFTDWPAVCFDPREQAYQAR